MRTNRESLRVQICADIQSLSRSGRVASSLANRALFPTDGLRLREINELFGAASFREVVCHCLAPPKHELVPTPSRNVGMALVLSRKAPRPNNVHVLLCQPTWTARAVPQNQRRSFWMDASAVPALSATPHVRTFLSPNRPPPFPPAI